MKIFKSIKWRLQIWYGLILVIVLAVLGFTAYQLERDLLFNRINGELERRFAPIAEALHPHPPGRDRRPFDRPPPDQMPDDLPLPGGPPAGEFHLPPQAAALFDSSDPHNFFYIIYGSDHTEIARSTNAPSAIQYASETAKGFEFQNAPPGSGTGKLLMATDNSPYAVARQMRSGEVVVIGCSIDAELHELKMTALNLAGVGGVILFFGLAGGWWISSRAIRPVENISAAAVKIASGDLSQRINVAETESELGRLAAVLNSTFERLDAAFTQQKQFAADAAHELRTPVSVILTQTQTALGREREAPEYKLTIEACERAAQRMRKLIGALLELARLDAGQEPMKQLRFELVKAITDCMELVQPLAEERGVKLAVDAVPPIEITGDPEKLGMVLMNLMTNAIQYNRKGGDVKVSARIENGMAVVIVTDTGAGISAGDLPRIFERFYRADKSRSSGNAGLGLAISRAIVAAHGGSMEATSKEHVETTFTVRLPL